MVQCIVYYIKCNHDLFIIFIYKKFFIIIMKYLYSLILVKVK